MSIGNRKILQGKHWEYVVPLLAIASLLTACIIISSKKYFWNDELFSYYLISEPSFSRMLTAFHDKINNTPFLYFLTGWFWDKIFGSTELSYRLFSSLGICVALGAVWVTLRRTYNFWPTTIGTLGVFCTSDIILSQNAEARMYGLFLAVCALAFLIYDQFCRKNDSSYKLLILNTCIHIAILHTHLFGAFYSGAILLALIITDKIFNIFRPKVYLSVILSWFTIILYLPSFFNQADAGKPRTWMPVPTLNDLIDFLNLSTSSFIRLTIVVFLVFISALQFLIENSDVNKSNLPKQHHPDVRSEISLLIFAFSFILSPVLIWIISRTLKPIFWERYMIPSALGYAILLTFVSSRLLLIPSFSNLFMDSLHTRRKIIRLFVVFSGLIMIAFLLFTPIQNAKRYVTETIPGFQDSSLGYSELPIVMQSSGKFLEREFYSPVRDRYFIILDWEAAVNIKSGVWATQEFKHLTALKRNFPMRFKNIQTTREFLDKYNRFLVIMDNDPSIKCPLVPLGLEMARTWEGMHCPQWMEMRIFNNAHYKVSFLKKDDTFPIYLVEKINRE
jgi:hypothetical protein